MERREVEERLSVGRRKRPESGHTDEAAAPRKTVLLLSSREQEPSNDLPILL